MGCLIEKLLNSYTIFCTNYYTTISEQLQEKKTRNFNFFAEIRKIVSNHKKAADFCGFFGSD